MRKRDKQLEEAFIREYLKKINPKKVDLWPEIQKKITVEDSKPEYSTHGRLIIVFACVAIMLSFLTGMAFHRFYVYHSDGSRTAMNDSDDAYRDSNGTKYKSFEEPINTDEIWFDYDWPERLTLPEPDNPFFLFLTDYEEFYKKVSENNLGIRLPTQSAIPDGYSQRPYFRASYYLTPEDLKNDVNPDKLPKSVLNQIGRYQMYWFTENKEPFSISCMPVESLDNIVGMFILSDDSTISYRPIKIKGFEKAFVITYYNRVFKKNGTDLIFCQKVNSTKLYDTAYEGSCYARKLMTAKYIRYQVQTVGLSEEDVINSVESAFSE